MANASQTIILTFKGNVAQLNSSIDSAIGKLNSLVKATSTATAGTATGAGAAGGIAGMLFNKDSAGILASGRNMIDGALAGLDNSVARVSRTFGTLQRSVQAVGDSLRLTSQAVSTLGRVWTVLISAPLGLFLKQQASFALDFEDQLKRVQKVTNWTTSQLGDFRDMLRDVAINTATSHIELAKISEVIGQSGIRDIKTMREMTETINMFSMATGIAADTAATNLIRIGNAFGWTEDKMADNVKKLGSVFNKLENTMATNADQVMKGTAEWAQQAYTLNIAESSAAAYTATLIAMGMSESEAGTAMKRFTAGLIQNNDAVVEAMQGIEGYSSAREVANSIDANAEKVIMDIVYAAEAGNSAALKLADSLEIGGVRGGRAIVALANNTDLMRRALGYANDEWENGLSLVQEYELAMSSTKNQMALLQNNINDVGVTLGDALLPMINEVIMVLVPAIRYVGDFIKTLDAGQKRMLVFGAIGAVALGPILFLFGQIVNSFSLVFLGLGRLILLIPQLYGAFVGLIKPVLLLGRLFLTWPGLIVVAVAGILKVLANTGVDIAGFFIDLGNKAVAWGERLAATYADGFLKGAVNFIAKALQWVANMIASFFKGASPPKVGPLSTIDKWGAKVMESYLKGFGKADFGILESVGRTIERTLTQGLEGKNLAQALEATAKARLDLSELIKQFNKTGKINDSLLKNITANLEPISDNVRQLIRHWLQYNKLQERISAIEDRRKQVKKTYSDELKAIAATNMSMQEKVEAIRAAQRGRDDNLRGLTEEQELLEEKASKEKEAYEYQQEMIDAMQTQDDLLQRIADALKAAADALGGMGSELGGGFGSFEWPDPEELGLEDTVNEAMDTLEQRLQKGKSIFDALIAGFKGEDSPMQEWLKNPHREKMGRPEGVDEAMNMYEIGQKAREIYDTISLWAGKGAEFVQTVIGGLQALAGMLDFSGMTEGLSSFSLEDIPFIKGFMDGFQSDTLIGVFKLMVDAIRDAGKALGTLFGYLGSNTTLWETLGEIAGFVISAIIIGITAIVGAIARIIEAWAYLMVILHQLWQIAVARLKMGWDGLVGLFKLGIAMLGLAWEWFKGVVETVWNNIMIVINTVIANIMIIIGAVMEVLKAIWEGRWGDIQSIVENAWNLIFSNISNMITQIKDNISGYMENIKTIWNTVWGNIKDTVTTKWQEMKATIDSYVILIKRKIQENFEKVKTIIQEKIEEAKTFAIEKLQALIDWITDAKTKMYNAGTNFLTGLWNGLKAKWESIEQWALDKFKWLTDLWAKMNKEGSPSKVQFEHGVNFMRGLQLGLEKGFVDVARALTNAYGSVQPATIDASSASMSPLFASARIGSDAPPSVINININDPVVRDDRDIDEIVRQVKRILQNDIRQTQAYGGYLR